LYRIQLTTARLEKKTEKAYREKAPPLYKNRQNRPSYVD
jgi:hypothetical protein